MLHPFSVIEQLWWAGPAAAVVVGIVLGASPLAWPLLATAAGVRSGATADVRDAATSRGVILTIGAGLTAVYASLGLLVDQLEAVIRDQLGAVAGVGYALLAVVAAGAGVALLRRPTATCRRLVSPTLARGGAFGLGALLGLVNCPACAGIITGVAVSAGIGGGTWYRVGVMAALGVGHTVTLLVASQLSLAITRDLTRSTTAAARIGGALLLVSAGYFVFQLTARGVAVAPTLP